MSAMSFPINARSQVSDQDLTGVLLVKDAEDRVRATLHYDGNYRDVVWFSREAIELMLNSAVHPDPENAI